ncbi:unnamed protein product, partial [Choristocarpus tenellus]
NDTNFECNICLDGVQEPVVTRCGHLYCWPCLYRWLNTNQTECPVCKAGVSANNIIPLYGRGADNIDPRTNSTGRDGVPSRPEAERLEAERPRSQGGIAGGASGLGGVWGAIGEGSMGFGRGEGVHGQTDGTGGLRFHAGLGFFPSLFGLQFQNFTNGTATTGEGVGAEGSSDGAAARGGGDPSQGGSSNVGGNVPGRVMSAEESQQAFLSKLLLILGSFVVMCLLLF